MSNGFEKVEKVEEETTKRRRKLDEKGSNIRPEVVEKTNFYADKKREEVAIENVKETPNVETDPNQ